MYVQKIRRTHFTVILMIVALQKNYNFKTLTTCFNVKILKKSYVEPWILFLALNVIISHSSIECTIICVRSRQHTSGYYLKGNNIVLKYLYS